MSPPRPHTTSGLPALLALLAVAVCQPASAQGRIERAEIASPMLGRAIPFSAYVPSGVAANGSVPVLYLLHGKGDTEMAWPENGGIAGVLDRRIAAGDLQPLIVVMPMAGNSWYVDDARPGGYGPMAKAVLDEFIPGIQARYPAAATCRAARSVGGLSMGGYGAMLYAFERPELFVAAFSLSGSLFSDQPAEIESRRRSYERIYDGVFGVPFDDKRFLQWNVFTRLDRRRDAPPAVYLVAGDRDFPAILAGTVRFHQELRRRGLPSELSVLPGDHSWAFWESTVGPALSWLSARLDPGCGGADRSNVKPPPARAAVQP